MTQISNAKQVRLHTTAIHVCCRAESTQKRHGLLRITEAPIVMRSAVKASRAAITVAPAAIDKRTAAGLISPLNSLEPG